MYSYSNKKMLIRLATHFSIHLCLDCLATNTNWASGQLPFTISELKKQIQIARYQFTFTLWRQNKDKTSVFFCQLILRYISLYIINFRSWVVLLQILDRVTCSFLPLRRRNLTIYCCLRNKRTGTRLGLWSKIDLSRRVMMYFVIPIHFR